MKPTFEWDEEKAKENLRDHHVDFDEAETVFDDPLSITIRDPDHSTDEERFLILENLTTGASWWSVTRNAEVTFALLAHA